MGRPVRRFHYSLASQAEALLILGRPQAAQTALARAVALNDGDQAALATTRRQLWLICETSALDPQVLDVLAGPPVVFYCGHRITAADQPTGFPTYAEDAVRLQIVETVNELRPGYAYGALASGADIMWAEALLASGSELHVVLPRAQEEFVRRSVAPAGRSWLARFERCLDAASSLRHATEEAQLTDDVLFRYGSELAMGLALLRARYLDAEVRQLAVWDGQPARGAAGTAVDVATWQRTGLFVTVIHPSAHEPPILETEADAPSPTRTADNSRHRTPQQVKRTIRALLFGDLTGFSKLSDEQIPRFAARVLAVWSDVLTAYETDIGHRHLGRCPVNRAQQRGQRRPLRA